MSREKRRISDGKGGYEKHLNKIPLALGCMAWQSDTPPTSNRIIRRLTESSFSSCHLLRSLANAARRFADYSRAKKEFNKEGRTNEAMKLIHKQIFL